MKTIAFVLWIALGSYASAEFVGLSPGIRLGWEFGETKGFVLGIGCGVFYWGTYAPGPVVSFNTFAQYAFGRKEFSQETDLTVGILGLLFASLGAEATYGKGFFSSMSPFYQFSAGLLDVDCVTYKKYFKRNERAVLFRLGFPIMLYSQGQLLNLNLGKFD